ASFHAARLLSCIRRILASSGIDCSEPSSCTLWTNRLIGGGTMMNDSMPGAGGPGAHGSGAPRLEGKVAVVTGAGSRGAGVGNGKAMAVLFAREGARVLLVDRERARAGETLDYINDLVGYGGEGQAAVFEADVTEPAACEAMIAEAVRR